MELHKAKADVSATLVDLAEQLELLLTQKGVMPQIELDIALQTTRQLYVSLAMLNRLNNAPQAPAVASVVEAPGVKPEEITKIVQTEVGKLREELFRTFNNPPKTNNPAPVVEPVTEPIITPAPKTEPAFTPAPAAVAEPKAEAFIAPQPVVEVVAPVVVADVVVPTVEPVATPEPFKTTVVETVTQPTNDFKTNTVHNTVSQTPPILAETLVNDNSLARKLTGKPISNIKSSININDKFQYLNVLFKGDVGAYNAHIDKLNNFQSFTDAEAYFNILKDNFKWDVESPLAAGLYDLVVRRYNS